MSKHTPGPWYIKFKTDPLEEDGCVMESPNDHEIRPAVGNKLGDEMADLRLIAAAPDLLEACQYALATDDAAVKYLLRAVIDKATKE